MEVSLHPVHRILSISGLAGLLLDRIALPPLLPVAHPPDHGGKRLPEYRHISAARREWMQGHLRPESRECQRRARQIAAGTLQVSK
jgi:hypothetical protein